MRGNKRILLLGGIGEALRLARWLAPHNRLTYSLAGRARVPALPCPVRVGGFGDVAGLAAFLKDGDFDLLIDATHPYAAQMSQHAALATEQLGVPLWAYRRPLWQPQQGDDWRTVADWSGVMAAISDFHRPFFTVGLEPLRYADAIPPGQHWLVRSLKAEPSPVSNMIVLGNIGPFGLDEELDLMRSYDVDVLVTKNSGGQAVAAKLAAARQLGIPVLMLARPELPAADLEFTEVKALYALLYSAWPRKKRHA